MNVAIISVDGVHATTAVCDTCHFSPCACSALVGDRCASCKGVAHEATGHRHSSKTLICGPCARKFFGWVVKHTRPRPTHDFYGAATRFAGGSR